MKTISVTVKIIFVLCIAVGGISLFVADLKESQARRAEFFGTASRYDTTGGQELRPQW